MIVYVLYEDLDGSQAVENHRIIGVYDRLEKAKEGVKDAHTYVAFQRPDPTTVEWDDSETLSVGYSYLWSRADMPPVVGYSSGRFFYVAKKEVL